MPPPLFSCYIVEVGLEGGDLSETPVLVRPVISPEGQVVTRSRCFRKREIFGPGGLKIATPLAEPWSHPGDSDGIRLGLGMWTLKASPGGF